MTAMAPTSGEVPLVSLFIDYVLNSMLMWQLHMHQAEYWSALTRSGMHSRYNAGHQAHVLQYVVCVHQDTSIWELACTAAETRRQYVSFPDCRFHSFASGAQILYHAGLHTSGQLRPWPRSPCLGWRL